MKKKKILVVEDEADILELIRYNLEREGYRVMGVETGEAALFLLEREHWDLVLLDLMLPGVDGLSVCRKLKEDPELRRLPVIMVTARGEESDVVAGLELGADDYVAKPFSPRELTARVRAVLRRSSEPREGREDLRDFGDLVILPRRYEVRVKGAPVSLTHTEFKVLLFLSGRPGWVFTRNQIIDGVQGEDHVVTDRSVDVQIVGLRRKLGEAGRHIETVRGVGYRFRE